MTAVVDPAAYQQVEVLLRAIETVRENYVDADEVSYAQLVEGALEGMFARLDPHSQYMSPHLFEKVRDSGPGQIDMTGIALGTNAAGELYVAKVAPGRPAARAGVRDGDRVLKIDGEGFGPGALAEAAATLGGKPGQLVTLELRAPGTDRVRTVGFERESPTKATVVEAEMLPAEVAGEAKIGYARIRQFDTPTARELEEVLDRFGQRGMQAFVLDLRSNPGGLLSAAAEVCGEFLPPATPIAKTVGRAGSGNSEVYKTPPTGHHREYPLAVLVDGASASSAEVVAGALQELGRATVVGDTTFGKGSVQSVIPMGLGTGAAMRLTTARFLTPGGREIDGRGIRPDIAAPGGELPVAAAVESLTKQLTPGAPPSP